MRNTFHHALLSCCAFSEISTIETHCFFLTLHNCNAHQIQPVADKFAGVPKYASAWRIIVPLLFDLPAKFSLLLLQRPLEILQCHLENTVVVWLPVTLYFDEYQLGRWWFSAATFTAATYIVHATVIVSFSWPIVDRKRFIMHFSTLNGITQNFS